MNTNVIIAILSLIFSDCIAQNQVAQVAPSTTNGDVTNFTEYQYHSFVSHKNVWQLYSPGFAFPPHNYQITISKDSVLKQGKYYFKYLSRKQGETSWKFDGSYCRQNGGIIYSKYHDNPEEIYLNFTLEKGDSILLYGEQTFKIEKIDTIITFDGLKRKRLTGRAACNTEDSTRIFIDGIGETINSFGMYDVCRVADPESDFNCFLVNDVLVYGNPGAEGCNSVSTEDLIKNDIVIRPNPVADQVVIETIIPVHFSEIYTITGYPVLKSYESEIQVKILRPGLYFLIITDISGRTYVKKFVKT